MIAFAVYNLYITYPIIRAKATLPAAQDTVRRLIETGRVRPPVEPGQPTRRVESA